MIFRFEGVEIDEERREVRHDGIVVEAPPKVFDVLLHLLRNRERVVTKDELLDALWEGLAVGDAVMARAIHGVRKLVGDPDSIKTFYGRGYRFVGAVSTADASNGEAALAAGALADTAGARPRRRLVGRATEHALVSECLASVLGGAMRTVAIGGEAGIGKTAICEHVATLAENLGFETLWGRCSEVPGAPAYWPFIQVLRQLIERMSASLVASALAAHPEARELADTRGFASATLVGDGEQARFRVFDSVSGFLQRAASARPLALVIDDLHCADTPSLLLLHFLVQHLAFCRVLVVVAYRDAELRDNPAGARWVNDLARQSGVHLLGLAGLDASEIAAFVEQAIGRKPDATAVEHLREQTAGNPFYLSQLAPLLAEPFFPLGALESPGAAGALPRSVRDAIESHLATLSATSRQLLEVAAVIGKHFTRQLLADVGKLEPEVLLELLRYPLQAGLVAESEHRGEFRFAHVLVRDALYAGLDACRRSELHHAVARAIERAAGADLDSVATELAHHFSHALDVEGAEKAVQYSLLAGDVALQRVAYEDAARAFDTALSALERMPRRDEQFRCDVLLKLASAYTRSGELEAGRNAFRRAADIARRLAAPKRLATVALELAPGFFSIEVGFVDRYVVERLEEAIGALGVADAALRVRVLGRLALALYWTDDGDRRAALCAEARTTALQLGTAEARLHALGARHGAIWSPFNLQERLEWSDELVTLATRLDDVDTLLVSRCFRITDLLERGDMGAVRDEIARFRKVAVESRQPECIWMADMYDSMLAMVRGEFARVERFGLQSIELGTRLRHHNAVQTGGVYLGMARGETGGVADLLPVLETNIENYPTSSWWGIYTMACMRADDRPRARAALTRALSALPRTNRNLTWLAAVCVLCETAAYLEAGDDAHTLAQLLVGIPKNHVTVGYGIMSIGALDRYLGLLALAEERWTDAIDHLSAAVEKNERIGAEAYTAHARRELARAYERRGQTGDGGRAERLIERSTETATRLGMAWLLNQIHLTSKAG